MTAGGRHHRDADRARLDAGGTVAAAPGSRYEKINPDSAGKIPFAV
jgi:hypothetical protein